MAKITVRQTFVNVDIPNSSTIYPDWKNLLKRLNFKYLNIFGGSMDNIQFWIYVIVIVITLIARAGKKKQVPPGSAPNEDSSGEPLPKPVSFEDLLREIQEAKSPKSARTQPAVQPVEAFPNKKYDFEDYDDNLKDEVKSLEKPDYTYQDDQIYETYEKAKKAAFERPSLEETLKVGDTVVKYGQFKEYSRAEKSSVAQQIRKDLADKENFKKAFILSEVLNRRF
jgi:hypothetical protein